MSSIRSLFSFAPPSAGGSETTAAVGGGVAVLYLRLRVFLYAGVAVLAAVTIPMGEAKGGLLVAAISGVLAVVATLWRHADAVSESPRLLGWTMILDVTVLGAGIASGGMIEVAVPVGIVMLAIGFLASPPRFTSVLVGYIAAWLGAGLALHLVGWQPAFDGSARSFFGVSIGVVALVVMGLVLRHAAEDMAHIDSLRNQLIGGVSHDLRNPLTGVLGAARLLADPTIVLDPAEHDELVRMIIEEGAEANRLVEDLLTATRADAGRLDLHPSAVDLGVEVRQALASLPGADRIEVAEAPVFAWADQVRVRQIVRNLATNALRYGGDRIAVGWERAGESVEVVVRDNGAGVPEEERESIFAPYRRASIGRRSEASVGLGLSIARRLARLMGGDLTYRRVEGWSEFVLRLPAAVETPAEPGVMDTRTGQIWLGDDGILRSVVYPHVAQTRDDAVTNMAVIEQLAAGECRPYLVHASQTAMPGRDALTYYASSPDSRRAFAAIAVVTDLSSITLTLIELLRRLGRPPFPIRAFSDEATAVRWLTAYLPPTETDAPTPSGHAVT